MIHRNNCPRDIILRYASDLPVLRIIQLVAGAEDRTNEAYSWGNLDVVQYLHAKLNVPITETSALLAANHGHVGCLSYAYNNANLPCDNNTNCAALAAQGGHLDCLRYVLKHW